MDKRDKTAKQADEIAQQEYARTREWYEKAKQADEMVQQWDEKAARADAKAQQWDKKAERAEAKEKEHVAEGAQVWDGETDRKTRRRKKKYHVSHSLVAKVFAFFLMAVSFALGLGMAILGIYAETEGYYTSALSEVLERELEDECVELLDRVKVFISGANIEGAERFCSEKNIDLELYTIDTVGREDELIWSTRSGYETDIVIDYRTIFLGVRPDTRFEEGQEALEVYKMYHFRIYVDPAFTVDDSLRQIARPIILLYDHRYDVIVQAANCALICCICFVFLMCGAGHRNKREGITPGVLTGIPLDILTAGFGLGVPGILVVAREVYDYFRFESMETILYPLLFVMAVGTVLFVWLNFYLLDFAIRVKRGKIFKNTLICFVLRTCWRALSFCGRGVLYLLRGMPLIVTTLVCYFALVLLEFFGVGYYVEAGGVLLWALEKIVLLPIVMYVAISCKKLVLAGKALAEGEENYRVNTSKMLGAMKEHGESLNSIGSGITRAVEERMKSERMKTELITNVSHDLKTPLTSIINYADLICEEKSENPKIAEYSEVLLRQSKRLKKLLEDLVEASKATTGNLEVNLEPCEVGVLLTQAVGEYQQKMEERELDLIVRQPENEVKILADGRHLWRVFDNLLNNICKYAQEKSRVYLSLEVKVEEKDERVLITFRNMSKYALDITPEELEERFVRGDKSRNIEGNGLGLSIAKSLVELQNGQMQIVTDGDLFKVVLEFRALKE